MADLPRMPPRATYRLQLTRDFTFHDAGAVAPLIARLGVSHAYLSPILTARPGSPHGYDVVDHTEISPELGGEAGFRTLADTLRRQGLGILLDIVPNHMGIGRQNARWMDLLRWGLQSASADFFDIEWRPPQADLQGKVLLPFLGGNPDALVAAGELTLAFDGAEFHVRYHDHAWPVTPASVGPLLEEAAAGAPPLEPLARDFSALAGHDGVPAALPARAGRLTSELAQRTDTHAAIQATVAAWNGGKRHRLRTLLDRQCWRLADWHRGAREINYRRFFAINDLIAIRVERPDVFEASHGLILRLMAEGLVDGLRIDHVDGLADPKAYLDRLANAIRANARGGCRAPYVLVEKILGVGEALPAAWPVAGTTGYDRLASIDRLFCEPDGAATLVADYQHRIGTTEDPRELLLADKRRFLKTEFASEMSRLARAARNLVPPPCRTLPPAAFERAFVELIARLPFYRTYVDETGIDAAERSRLMAALEAAALEPPELARFLAALLSGDMARGQGDAAAPALAVVRLFQQVSGPAMAKGLEDTVFFQYVPLLALNEVGGAPWVTALSPSAFHEINGAKIRTRPHELIASSTHDTKRGEDARARLLCLTSAPELWRAHLDAWQCDPAAPQPKDAVQLLQSLVGAWPPGLAADDAAGLAALAARVAPAMLKAAREAKERTSWTAPDPAYEAALETYVKASLDPRRSADRLAELAEFCETLGFWGALTSLSTTLLRLTTPGIPDIYQGADGWHLALVDPDNRRSVDFGAAAARLAAPRLGMTSLRTGWHDGAAKSWLIRETLALRRERPALFAAGAYRPLPAEGAQASRLVAFAREGDAGVVVVLVPRFWPRLWPARALHPAWGVIGVALPPGRYRNRLTGDRLNATGQPQDLALLLGDFPVGLLASED